MTLSALEQPSKEDYSPFTASGLEERGLPRITYESSWQEGIQFSLSVAVLTSRSQNILKLFLGSLVDTGKFNFLFGMPPYSTHSSNNTNKTNMSKSLFRENALAFIRALSNTQVWFISKVYKKVPYMKIHLPPNLKE